MRFDPSCGNRNPIGQSQLALTLLAATIVWSPRLAAEPKIASPDESSAAPVKTKGSGRGGDLDQPEPNESPEPAQPACPPNWYCEPQPEDTATTERGPVMPPAPTEAERPPEVRPASPSGAVPDPPHRVELSSPPFRSRSAERRLRFSVGARASLPLIERSRRVDESGVGLGLLFRYFPSEIFAVELAADRFWVTDHAGDFREEIALSGSLVLFPRLRRRLRPQLIAGFFVSTAELDAADGRKNLSHAGAQLGFGVEYLALRRLGVAGELLGFVRGRIDPDPDQPEFVDDTTGRQSDTSGGGLLRIATTFYW